MDRYGLRPDIHHKVRSTSLSHFHDMAVKVGGATVAVDEDSCDAAIASGTEVFGLKLHVGERR